MENNLHEAFVGKFVGPNKITEISAIEMRTPKGGYIFEVGYEDGTKEIYPETGFMLVVSDEAKDFNHIRDARVQAMVPEILNTIKEYDIPYEQFTWLMSQVAAQWQNHFNRANAVLWFGDASRYVPGSDTTDRLSLLMADRVNATAAPTE